MVFLRLILRFEERSLPQLMLREKRDLVYGVIKRISALCLNLAHKIQCFYFIFMTHIASFS